MSLLLRRFGARELRNNSANMLADNGIDVAITNTHGSDDIHRNKGFGGAHHENIIDPDGVGFRFCPLLGSIK
jgi:hypothetical protein